MTKPTNEIGTPKKVSIFTIMELLYSELVKRVSVRCSVDEKLIRNIIAVTTDVITEGVRNNQKVHLGHLGMFYAIQRKSQKYFNGKTAPGQIIKFRPTRLTRKSVKNGKES